MRDKFLMKQTEWTFFHALKTVGRAMFGVQSYKDQEQAQRELSWVMVAAAMLFLLVAFILAVQLIVHLVLINH